LKAAKIDKMKERWLNLELTYEGLKEGNLQSLRERV